MDHHLAETRAAMIREAHSRGHLEGMQFMITYLNRSHERRMKELEKGNPFKWLGDFLKKKFNKGSSPETVIPDPSGNS